MINVMMFSMLDNCNGYLTSLLNDAIIPSIPMSAERFTLRNTSQCSPFITAKLLCMLAMVLPYLALSSEKCRIPAFSIGVREFQICGIGVKNAYRS